MLAVCGCIEGVVVRKRSVGSKRDGLLKHCLPVNHDVYVAAAGLAQVVNFKVIAVGFEPGALISFGRGETDSGQPVNPVGFDAPTYTIYRPTRSSAAQDSAPRRGHRVARNHVARASIAEVALKTVADLRRQDVCGGVGIAEVHDPDGFYPPFNGRELAEELV